MAHLIQLKSGETVTIFDERDALDLIGEHLGWELQHWLEDWLSENDDASAYIDELENEADSLRAHHKEVMQVLREQSEIIAGLIREKEIDRKKLSTAAGVIGTTTWREINVR